MDGVFYNLAFLAIVLVFFPSMWRMRTEAVNEEDSWSAYLDRAWVTCFFFTIAIRSIGRLAGFDFVDTEAFTFTHLYFGVGTLQSMLIRALRKRRTSRG